MENRDVAVPPTPTRREVALPLCEEREPGELDVAEIHALD